MKRRSPFIVQSLSLLSSLLVLLSLLSLLFLTACVQSQWQNQGFAVQPVTPTEQSSSNQSQQTGSEMPMDTVVPAEQSVVPSSSVSADRQNMVAISVGSSSKMLRTGDGLTGDGITVSVLFIGYDKDGPAAQFLVVRGDQSQTVTLHEHEDAQVLGGYLIIREILLKGQG